MKMSAPPFVPFQLTLTLLDTDGCSVVLADGIPGLYISVTAQAS